MNRLGLISIFFISFFIFGCSSTPKIGIIYDSTIPDEQSSILFIPSELTVIRFNEETVSWKSGWGVNVRIPAGEHTLVIDYRSVTVQGSWRTISTAEGLNVTFDYKPGITYELHPIAGLGVVERVIGNFVRITVREKDS